MYLAKERFAKELDEPWCQTLTIHLGNRMEIGDARRKVIPGVLRVEGMHTIVWMSEPGYLAIDDSKEKSEEKQRKPSITNA